MEVLLADRQKRLPPSARILKAIARRVLEGEDSAADEVSIVLGDDTLLADLNARFKGRTSRTDVLSFPMGRIGDHVNLGEVVVSTDRALAQAGAAGRPLAEEVTRLLIHGLLHLLGYQHGTAFTRRSMRRRESEHLDRLEPWVERLAERYQSVKS